MIDSIYWSVYGKILEIDKPDTTITFTYNPAGQRTSKGTGRTTTYYVRDAQGNIMAVYQTQKFGTLWTEQHLYGSSRIGMWIPGVEPNNKTQKYRAIQQGTRLYELDNHLGNDGLCDTILHQLQGDKKIWVIGERVQLLLADAGLIAEKYFPVPNAINAVTPLTGQILVEIENCQENKPEREFFIFHNQPKQGAIYAPVIQRLLPLDKEWQREYEGIEWPSKNIPGIIGQANAVLLALIREYLFVSLFRACAESLASENSSRLSAMQRADKNIGNMLDSISHKFHRLRQSSIDENYLMWYLASRH